jgi:lipoprotein NlpI
VEASLAGFDRLIALDPSAEPYLWQRGIALYYAGRYDECRTQFERHRAVNPADVENAAWHFLCVARGESSRAAAAKLLPVGPDQRRPMREIYGLFEGRVTEAQVMAAAGNDPSAQFFANLYVGLYLEAMGRAARSRERMALAAADRFASVGGYMHDVARVHLAARHPDP